MRKILIGLMIGASWLSLPTVEARAQSDEPKYEVGVGLTFSVLRDIGFRETGRGTEVGGVAGRFGYGLQKYVSLDSEVAFLPGNSANIGNIVQGQFGVKAGARAGRFGVFGKIRPGFMRFAKDPFPEPGSRDLGEVLRGIRRFDGRTVPTLDLGGVIEFYTKNNFIVRVDLGDTIIRLPDSNRNTGSAGAPPPRTPVTSHNLQAGVGIGYRF